MSAPMFEPIAIVGQGCLLPGADSPAALFEAVRQGRSLLSPTPPGRWRLSAAQMHALAAGEGASPREAGQWVACTTGGYVLADVRPRLDAALAQRIANLDALDAVVPWLLYCAEQALRPWRSGASRPADPRCGLIVGHLSYPTQAATELARAHWQRLMDGRDAPARDAAGADSPCDWRNRFHSGLPVQLAAQALGFGGPSLALDAACASSLYALKLACDALHDRRADLMLAGGINRADNLFLHLGFTALQALSPSGRSRPFHREADGLIPAEGAALFALRRLDDARRAGDRVLGVIRGIGLSNDGRAHGLLSPSSRGQCVAMREALAQARWQPADVQYVECHATGTIKGDAVELASLAEVYGGAARPAPLRLGSLKANIGHAITASGAASLCKVLQAFEARRLAPAPCDAPLPALREHGFELPEREGPWPAGPLRAAISSFGFGGTNAHLLVEAFEPDAAATTPSVAARGRDTATGPAGEGAEPVALCAAGIVTGAACGLPAFAALLLDDAGTPAPATALREIELPLDAQAGPPADLQASLPQHTVMLQALQQALAALPQALPARTAVVVGMGGDAMVARHELRMQAVLAGPAAAAAFDRVNARAAPRLTHAAVLGAMPNLPAARASAIHDWQGPAYTVASEELSGLDALQAAVRALRAGEADAAVVGAVDLCCEPLHEAAARAVLDASRQHAGDAAVAWVLKRAADARRDGDTVLAWCLDAVAPEPALPPAEDDAGLAERVAARVGHAHAASGLVQATAAVVALRAAVAWDAQGTQPRLGRSRARVAVRSFCGVRRDLNLLAPAEDFSGLPAGRPEPTLRDAPRLRCYTAPDLAALGHCVAQGASSLTGGPVRLGLLGASERELDELQAHALSALRAGRAPLGPGICFVEQPLGGEVAAVFTGAAAAYPGAARELLLGWPEVGRALAARYPGTQALARRFFAHGAAVEDPRLQLAASALVCQWHAWFTRHELAIAPQAAIGLSSGEVNALIAFDVWRDFEDMLQAVDDSGMYGTAMTGRFEAAAMHWGEVRGDGTAAAVDWRNWHLAAPVDAVRAALTREARAYLTIVYTADDCVIGGDAGACERVIEAVRREAAARAAPPVRAVPLSLDAIVHCEALRPFAGEWRRVHSRDTFPCPGVRFYSQALQGAYVPTRESVADAITAQALETIDFPRTIEQAWHDGVRIFIEHGPRAILATSIDRILGDRPHLAVALDRPNAPGLQVLGRTVLALWAHGVAVDMARFVERLHSAAPVDALRGPSGGASAARVLRLPAHRPPLQAWAAPGDRPALAAPAEIAAPAVSLEPALQPMPPAPPRPAALMPWPPVTARQDAAAPRHDAAAIHRVLASARAAHQFYLQQQGTLHAQFLRQRRFEPGPSAPAPARDTPPVLNRRQLETLATGRVSDVLGPSFAAQDRFHRQVRMPAGPLLLADRITRLEGVPGSMKQARLVSETDVREGWYLHAGRMAMGVLVESGQADLLLCSWLGVDSHNRGERVYRLLGCELTFHGGLPQAGDTLRFEVQAEGFVESGDLRLFLFRYDCHVGDRLLMQVRNGQAGFFTDEQLAQSKGVLWDARMDAPAPHARLDAAPQASRKRRFSRDEVQAFVRGDAHACFGAGFERAASHQRTPNVPGGRLQLFDDVPVFEPGGGPWQRGYLEARAVVPVDAWFYDGHFLNDPCMPGTLIAEASVQLLSFMLAALGFTIERDGWRFEPVAGDSALFVCRGQITPERERELVYEVHVEEIVDDGARPLLRAAVLCRCEGIKVFHCRHLAVGLVPDWPLAVSHSAPGAAGAPHWIAPGLRGDTGALMACANGLPSHAFGPLLTAFDDGVRRPPRLPSAPYHFMSRVERVDGEPGRVVRGARAWSEYQVPHGAWYFGTQATREPAVPLPVMAEILMQPCGWMASFSGVASGLDHDVCCRNLTGTPARFFRPVAPGMTLQLQTRLVSSAHAADRTLMSFEVTCSHEGQPVASLHPTFGFFTTASLRQQVGMPGSSADAWQALLRGDGPEVPEDLHAALPALGTGALRVWDRITGWQPRGGAQALGRITASARVDPGAWFFKAHFYQDPVMPGSLGLHALLQLLQLLAARHVPPTRSPADGAWTCGNEWSWRFGGQVTPDCGRVAADMEITALEDRGGSWRAVGNGSYWVDGRRIYDVRGLAVDLPEPR